MPLSAKNSDLLYQMLALIDLTSLNENDSVASIQTMCERGNNLVAAVCVFPQFIHVAKQTLHNSSVKIASVCNFPKGTNTILKTVADIKKIITQGANEIDVVIPYQEYLLGNRSYVQQFLYECRQACLGFTLKIIIETGMLEKEHLIRDACEDVILAHADFIKTSTGKVSVGASLPAAKIILSSIINYQAHIGIKISGGVQTVDQALSYLSLAKEMMGENWIKPENFRLGASKLFDNIQQSLASKSMV